MSEKKTALITGATSGIGAEFARQLASMGFDLIITGRRKKDIQIVADTISSKYKVSVEVIIAELSERNSIEKISKRILKTPNLKFLVNNAGFGIEGVFHETDFSAQERMLIVHNLAVMNLTHSALTVMIKSGEGSIINVSSLSSRVFMPRFSIYNATKSFLVAFTETLHMELKSGNIKVQVLCPGFTRTDFHLKMGYTESDLPDKGIIRWMKSSDVVNISLKALNRGKVICVPGLTNKIVYILTGLLPRKILYAAFSTASGMREFFGRK